MPTEVWTGPAWRHDDGERCPHVRLSNDRDESGEVRTVQFCADPEWPFGRFIEWRSLDGTVAEAWVT